MALADTKDQRSDSMGGLASLLTALATGAGGLGAIRVLRNFPRNQVKFLDELLRLVKRGDEPLYEALHYDYPKGANVRPLQKTANVFGQSTYNPKNPIADPVDLGINPELLKDQNLGQALRALFHEMQHPEISRLSRRNISGFQGRLQELPREYQELIQDLPNYYSGRSKLEEIAVRLAEEEFARKLGLPPSSRLVDFPEA